MQTRLPSQALRLLWAFDFDGVVCHSAKELCITGMLKTDRQARSGGDYC